MDQTKKATDPESFTRNVESTIDELFKASREIEIDPLTGEVKDLSQEETDQGPSFQVEGQEEEHPEEIRLPDFKELEAPAEQMEVTADEILGSGFDLGLEDKETEAVNLEQQINQLNQIFLTLEWELDQTQVVSAKKLAETIQKNPEIEADKNLHELLYLMSMTLEGMADHPEKMPTSGPVALQRGLDVLKTVVWSEEQDTKAEEELFKSAKKELESAIGMEVPEVACGDAGETALKEKFPGQQEQPVDSVLGAGTQEKVVPIESEYLALADMVKSHIKILDECIGHILPIEKLLSRTPGMEKLYHFQEYIKGRLEEQKKILERALTGDYEPSIGVPDYAVEHTRDIPMEIDKKEEITSVDIPCPWHELVVAQCEQKQVAFAPEDVAFAGTVPWWARNGLKKLDTFKLKKLKTWPWTKLKPLMQGELSNQEESQLIKLEFPVLQKSSSSFGYSQPSGNPTVLVLYRADKGLVLMLDTSLETISITPGCSWEPSAERNGPWVGNLEIENRQISVATLESLSNTLTNE
jgi:hypothetical protein